MRLSQAGWLRDLPAWERRERDVCILNAHVWPAGYTTQQCLISIALLFAASLVIWHDQHARSGPSVGRRIKKRARPGQRHLSLFTSLLLLLLFLPTSSTLRRRRRLNEIPLFMRAETAADNWFCHISHEAPAAHFSPAVGRERPLARPITAANATQFFKAPLCQLLAGGELSRSAVRANLHSV